MQSTRVAEAAYDWDAPEQEGYVYLKFPDGVVYRYGPATAHDWSNFANSPSKGRAVKDLEKLGYERVEVDKQEGFKAPTLEQKVETCLSELATLAGDLGRTTERINAMASRIIEVEKIARTALEEASRHDR
jgi:hypothetical protein